MRPLLFILLVTGAAQAASDTQTYFFPIISNVSGTGVANLGGQALLTTSFSPFDPSLGSLESFTIVWDFDANANGVVGGATGSFVLSFGGAAYIGEEPFAAGGSSSGANGTLNQGLSRLYDVTPINATFLASDAALYPDLFAAVTGNTNFETSWDSPVTLTYTNLAGLSLLGGVTTSITYNYSVVPEPSVTGLVAAAAAAGLMKRRRRF